MTTGLHWTPSRVQPAALVPLLLDDDEGNWEEVGGVLLRGEEPRGGTVPTAVG